MASMVKFLLPVGDVEVQEIIGTGRFSQVFGANFKNSQGHICPAAAKKVRSNAMQQKEVEILNKLNHKNIIKFYGVYIREKDETFIIMELAERKDLRHFLNSYRTEKTAPVRLPPGLVWKWVIESASALQYLHALHQTHRDVKSLNYLVMRDFTLKLGDLGLAKELFHTSKTKRGGTCQWMAPEVIEHQIRSPKSDVFSYGMVVWEITSTEIPYASIKGDYNIMTAICDGKRPEIGEDCPQELKHLMECCWNKEHNQRPAMDEISRELETRKAAGLPGFSPEEVDLQVKKIMGPPSTGPQTQGNKRKDVHMLTASPTCSRDQIDGHIGAGGDSTPQTTTPGMSDLSSTAGVNVQASPLCSAEQVDHGHIGAGGDSNPRTTTSGFSSTAAQGQGLHAQRHVQPQPFRFPAEFSPQQSHVQGSVSGQIVPSHMQSYSQSPIQDTIAPGMMASGFLPVQPPHQIAYGYSPLLSQVDSGTGRTTPTSRSMEDVLSDLFLLNLAKEIGPEFTQLGIQLGFTLAQTNRVKAECPHSLSDAILKLLVNWRQRQDRRQTTRDVVEKLAVALANVERQDLASTVRSQWSTL